MINFKFFFIPVFIISIIFSCVPHKKIIYFQNNGAIKSDTVFTLKDVYKIQPGDVLSIQVSSFNPEATEFFNQKVENKLGGYIVYSNGFIKIPILDSVYVKNLTIIQVQDSLIKYIGEHTSKPYLTVNLVNFKISFLGEFGTKGQISTSNNEMTIIEAISLAGDMSDLADKRHVKLIRKEGDRTIFVTLDLTKRDIMETKYFYVQPNDVLYAQPLKVKALRTNITQITTYVSLISFVFLIYNFVNILKANK